MNGKKTLCLMEYQSMGKEHCVLWNVSQWEKDTMLGGSSANGKRICFVNVLAKGTKALCVGMFGAIGVPVQRGTEDMDDHHT